MITDFTADTVGITTGNVEERAFAGSLIVSDGAFDHVTEIVELMTEILYEFPTMLTCPLMRVFRVHGTTGIEIAVRFLSCLDDGQDTVHVLLSRDDICMTMALDGQFQVREGLQEV